MRPRTVHIEDSAEALRVLIIDDEPEVARWIKLRLAREAPQLAIEELHSGRDCLEYLKNNHADCILSDFQMPGMTGLELLKKLREAGDETPFIFITAQGNEEVAREAFKAGAFDYFTKDVGFAHFTRIINSVEQAVRHRRIGLEKSRAEEVIAASESRYRELFNGINTGVAVYEAVDDGRDFIFRDFNRGGERIEYISRDELVGRPVTEVFPGIDEFGLLEVFRHVWRTGEPEKHPVALYKDDRVSGWKENYVYKLPSGEIVAVYEDVTSRVKAELEILDSREKCKALFDSAADAIFVHDLEGRIVEVNLAACDMLGYGREELMGMTVMDVERGLTVEMLRELWDSVAGGQPGTVECEAVRKDGSTFPVQVRVGLVRLKDNPLAIAIVRDMSGGHEEA